MIWNNAEFVSSINNISLVSWDDVKTLDNYLVTEVPPQNWKWFFTCNYCYSNQNWNVFNWYKYVNIQMM